MAKAPVRRHNYRRTFYQVFVFAMAFTLSFLAMRGLKRANAGVLDGFNPGNIISDYVMSNYTSMTEAEIQSFLKSKNACNNTDIYLANYYPWVTYSIKDGHFVCMADDLFDDGNGGKTTAAHLIWQTAQEYRINPQVLIVLLQKEQGLVTDTWPNSVQYRAATGFGCPDTAPCDAEYYGLKNQLENAAWLFRVVLDGGWTNYPVGWNYVRYNPNAACGGTNVYIENRATSSLYRYTPYQPNASALAAGYGLGDSCGAYGNRNFYLYFTEWFGDTHKDRWENMSSPRVMTIKQNTMEIKVDTSELLDWRMAGESYYFTSKTLYYKDGEMLTCLRTKEDTDAGNPNCLLIDRMSEYDPTYQVFDEPVPLYTNRYTCKVNLPTLYADCTKLIEANTALNATAMVTIGPNNYYILQSDYNQNDYGVLAARVEHAQVNFTDIDETYLRVVNNSMKINPNDGASAGQVIAGDYLKISSYIVTPQGVTYYRTSDDARNNLLLAIPQSDLTQELFVRFISPRNLMVSQDISSLDIMTGQKCETYTKGTIAYFVAKADVAGRLYYQTSQQNSDGSRCAIPSDYLVETQHQKISSTSIKIEPFLLPRNLELRHSTYAIDIYDQTTCAYLHTGDTSFYENKFFIGQDIYYQISGSGHCALPATALHESSNRIAIADLNDSNFSAFIYPRKLRITSDTFSVDLKNGTTCSYLAKGTVIEYISKIQLYGNMYYRSETDTQQGTTCAVSANLLSEI